MRARVSVLVLLCVVLRRNESGYTCACGFEYTPNITYVCVQFYFVHQCYEMRLGNAHLRSQLDVYYFNRKTEFSSLTAEFVCTSLSSMSLVSKSRPWR